MWSLAPWEMDAQGKRDLHACETLLGEITSSDKLNKA